MNPIPEESFSANSSHGNIKVSGTWRAQLVEQSPSTTPSSRHGPRTPSNAEEDEDEYESDWEKEISDKGEVFYVLPYSEQENRQAHEALASKDINDQQRQDSNSVSQDRSVKSGGKLSRLVRRRESKRDRNMPASLANQNGSSVSSRKVKSQNQQQLESSDNDSSTYYGQLKTFESVFEGSNPIEMHEVNLRIRGRKAAPPGGSLIEHMMGVIPVRQQHKDGSAEETQYLNSVIVAGYLTEGPAIKISDKLRVGDVIRLVDGQQVNLATIDQLLSTYNSSTKVKLTIQRPSKTYHDVSSSSQDDSSAGSEEFRPLPQLVKILTGNKLKLFT